MHLLWTAFKRRLARLWVGLGVIISLLGVILFAIIKDRIIDTVNRIIDHWLGSSPITQSVVQEAIQHPIATFFIVWAFVIALILFMAYRETRVCNFLDLRVEFRQPVVPMRPSAETPVEDKGWMFYLGHVIIVNRSKINRVSLLATLHLGLTDNPQGIKRLSLREDDPGSVIWKIMYANAPFPEMRYLRCPINIEPEQTAQGGLGFWVDPLMDRSLGGVTQCIKKPDGYAMDAIIELFDYLSRRRVQLQAPGVEAFAYETRNMPQQTD